MMDDIEKTTEEEDDDVKSRVATAKTDMAD